MQINYSNNTPDLTFSTGKISGKAETPKVDVRLEENPPEQKTEHFERLQKLESSLAEYNIDLKFTKNDETKQIVVEMIDSRTGEIVRQLPSEVSVKLAEIYNGLQGRIINKHF